MLSVKLTAILFWCSCPRDTTSFCNFSCKLHFKASWTSLYIHEQWSYLTINEVFYNEVLCNEVVLRTNAFIIWGNHRWWKIPMRAYILQVCGVDEYIIKLSLNTTKHSAYNKKIRLTDFSAKRIFHTTMLFYHQHYYCVFS